MAGLGGHGIGSFISGFAGGLNVVHEWDKDEQDAKYKERLLNYYDRKEANDVANEGRKMTLLENADKRAAAEADRSTAESQANAPLLAAKRDAALTELSDAASDRSTKKAAGEAAVAGYKADPQKYGSVAEAYRAIAVPKVVESYLQRGDTASADAFSKWAADKRVENGINTVGDIERSFRRGDFDAVSKNYNKLMSDSSYMPQTGWKYSSEPIKDETGKAIGLRATTTSPDGKSSSEDYHDLVSMHGQLMPMISPETMFGFAKQQLEEQRSAKSERAKGLNKLSDEIDLERVKSAGRIAEERAKALGPQGMKDYSDGVLQVMKYQSENNTGFAKLPADQQAAQAAQIYEQVRARSGQGATPAAVPTSRNLGSPQPAPAPVAPKSIMPSLTRKNPY